jgi:hypothetical protein
VVLEEEEEEEKEEEEEDFGTSISSAVRLNKTNSETCDYLGGFFNDN